MVKYFSEILAKFTVGQRVFVLVLLLLALIVVTIGPIYINTLNPNVDELNKRLDNQVAQINSLNGQLTNHNNKILDLNNQLITNQQDCTNKIIKREKEIIDEIDRIEKSISELSEPEPTRMYNRLETDTNTVHVNAMLSIPDPSSDNNKEVISKLERLKRKIKKG